APPASDRSAASYPTDDIGPRGPPTRAGGRTSPRGAVSTALRRTSATAVVIDVHLRVMACETVQHRGGAADSRARPPHRAVQDVRAACTESDSSRNGERVTYTAR